MPAKTQRPAPDLSGSPPFVLRVGMRDLDGEMHDLGEARALLSRYPLKIVLLLVSQINAHLWYGRQLVDIRTRDLWVRRLCSPETQRLIAKWVRAHADATPFVFFEETQLLTAFRLALDVCGDGARVEQRPLDDLARALFIVSDHMGNTGGQPDSDEWFIRQMAPGAFFQYPQARNHAAARWECLTHDIPQRYPEVASTFDFASAFKQATGQDISTFRALAFGALACFAEVAKRNYVAAHANDRDGAYVREEPPMAVRQQEWLRHYHLMPEEHSLLDMLVATRAALADEFNQAPALDQQPMHYRPFRQRPLVSLDGCLWCPSVRLLSDKLTVGPYHTVLTHLKSRRCDPNEFHKARGQAFDIYALELFRRALGNRPSTRMLYPERDWAKAGRRRCDLLVVEGDRVLAVEFKSGLAPEPVTTGADTVAFRKYVSDNVAVAAGQIADTILDIEMGDPSVRAADVNAAQIRAYAPVVVTLDVLPRMIPVANIVEATSAVAVPSPTRKTRRIEMIDIRTLEDIESSLKSGAVGLSDLVYRKLATDPKGTMSFMNFAQAQCGSQSRNEYLEGVCRRLEEETREFWSRRESPSA